MSEEDAEEYTLESLYYQELPEILDDTLIDISSQAAWTASSTKDEFVVSNLRDNKPTTFWQSDGGLPHSITIEFRKRVSLKAIALFLYYSEDESYTPSSLDLYTGNGPNDMIMINSFNLTNPDGWHTVLLGPAREDNVLKCFRVRVDVHSNVDNGKDSRIRGIKMLAQKVDNQSNLR